MNSDWAPAITLSVMFLSFASIFVLRGPLGRALADRLSERSSPHLSDVEELRRRLADVEERLDFAERQLTRQRDAEPLPRPR